MPSTVLAPSTVRNEADARSITAFRARALAALARLMLAEVNGARAPWVRPLLHQALAYRRLVTAESLAAYVAGSGTGAGSYTPGELAKLLDRATTAGEGDLTAPELGPVRDFLRVWTP
jgi:hypothetical protein